MKHSIFIVDDHPIMRLGYHTLINREPDLECGGEATRATEALEKIPTAHPDLVIVDISMEGMDGIELTKHLRELHPSLPVLVVSMHHEDLYCERALRAGARGYLMKSEVGAYVIDAIRRLLSGEMYVSLQMSTKILQRHASQRIPETQTPIESLSDRELEVFKLVGKGLSTREIAGALFISPKTVESHRLRIRKKLAVESNARLVQKAVQWAEQQKLI